MSFLGSYFITGYGFMFLYAFLVHKNILPQPPNCLWVFAFVVAWPLVLLIALWQKASKIVLGMEKKK